MKTLIVHPKDRSTDFLDILYTPIIDKTVIKGGVTKLELKKLIKDHDRVMMMGHGSPQGLFSVGQFRNTGGHIIDETMLDVLREKDNNVFIWCNADKFVESYKLKGFSSGMFISEVGEAVYCGLTDISQKIVDESNYGFCNIFAKYVNQDKDTIYENVKKEYSLIAEQNPVAEYNNQRLYNF